MNTNFVCGGGMGRYRGRMFTGGRFQWVFRGKGTKIDRVWERERDRKQYSVKIYLTVGCTQAIE